MGDSITSNSSPPTDCTPHRKVASNSQGVNACAARAPKDARKSGRHIQRRERENQENAMPIINCSNPAFVKARFSSAAKVSSSKSEQGYPFAEHRRTSVSKMCLADGPPANSSRVDRSVGQHGTISA